MQQFCLNPGIQNPGIIKLSCYLPCYRHVLWDYSCGIREGSLGKKQDLVQKPSAYWKGEEDPPSLARTENKNSQTTQCGCRQPLPTDRGDVVFIAPSLPFTPTSPWEQPAAGRYWQPQSPKPQSISGPARCSVPWLAGGLPSGLPVCLLVQFRCRLHRFDSCALPTS